MTLGWAAAEAAIRGLDYLQLADAAGSAVFSCEVPLVLFPVAMPLQSLALPPSLLAPPLLPLPPFEPLPPLLPLPLSPALPLFEVDPEPLEVPELDPEFEPEPEPLPLLPELCAIAEVARPMESTEAAIIFKNMVSSWERH
jgi:hypothetical protein